MLAQVHAIAGVKIEVKKAVKDKDRLNRQAGGGGTGANAGGFNLTGGNTGMNNMSMMNNMNMMGNGGMAMNNMGYNNAAGNMAANSNGRKRGIDRDFPAMKKQKMEIRDPESEIMRSIFVGNLNPLVEQEELEEYFAKFGTVSRWIRR